MEIPRISNPEGSSISPDLLESPEYAGFPGVHAYAQTNIQLYKQLKSEGYSFEEINHVRKAYDLATDIFACLYYPSGKTYLAHIVGIGSILGSLGLPIPVVAAGLIHDIYEFGDFGKGWTLDQKTQLVQQTVGQEISRYVEGYQALTWSAGTIQSIRNQLSHLGLFEREVLLIRLARELEELLDGGILFCPDAEERRLQVRNFGALYVELGQMLGYPNLTLGFKQAIADISEAPIILPLRPKGVPISTKPFRLLPPSYTYGFFADFQNFMNRGVRSLTGIFESFRWRES